MRILASILFLVVFTHGMSGQAEVSSRNLVAGGSMNFYLQQNLLGYSPIYIIDYPGGILTSSSTNHKSISFSLSPYIAKDLSSRWLLGIQVLYSFHRNTSEGNITDFLGNIDTFSIKQTDSGYGLGLFGRYTFNPENRFQVNLQPAVNFTFANDVDLRDEVVTGEAESYSFGIVTSLGILYELSDQFSLTSRLGSIGFTTGQWTDIESDDSTNFSSFSTALNLTSLYFGFEFRF